jgi:hypothetical protein
MAGFQGGGKSFRKTSNGRRAPATGGESTMFCALRGEGCGGMIRGMGGPGKRGVGVWGPIRGSASFEQGAGHLRRLADDQAAIDRQKAAELARLGEIQNRD